MLTAKAALGLASLSVPASLSTDLRLRRGSYNWAIRFNTTAAISQVAE